jgi:hypothetical protein
MPACTRGRAWGIELGWGTRVRSVGRESRATYNARESILYCCCYLVSESRQSDHSIDFGLLCALKLAGAT